MNTICVVPGLFGGLERKYYLPLAEMFDKDEFKLFRAGEDWNPNKIAEEIRQIEGNKIVICLSLGAMVGNLLAEDTNTEVFYICPYLGVEFLNRKKKGYAYTLRYVFRFLATVLTAIAGPFKKHRWYPLYGGTKPDGWFLSVYAICKQLKFAFSVAPAVNAVDGAIFSYGDTFVEPSAVRKTSLNVVVAKREDGKGPAHANLRMEGEAFGSANRVTEFKLSEDAKAYLVAFAKLLHQRSR